MRMLTLMRKGGGFGDCVGAFDVLLWFGVFLLGVEMGGITSFGSIPADREKPVAIPRATVSLMLMAVESGLVLHR